MTVYVESNFVLELAYLQEEHESCESLLGLAEDHKIELALPAFSITEARLSLGARAERRRKFRDHLARELRELIRSKPYDKLSSTTDPLTRALIDSIEEERKRFEPVLARLLKACNILAV